MRARTCLGIRPGCARVPVRRRFTARRSTLLRSNATLLIDNYDSYTYNLYQLIAATYHREPLVVLNDAYFIERLEEEILANEITSVIISPGPGNPNVPRDIGQSTWQSRRKGVRLGVCEEVFRRFPWLPILGVCLGHQVLAAAYGGEIQRVAPVHGRLSGVVHNGHGLFRDVPCAPQLQVVRYHSLAVVESSLPPCLKPIAWTAYGSHALRGNRVEMTSRPVLMALAHERYPHYGVQFHPESVGSTYGAQLLSNFHDLALSKVPRVSSGAGYRRPKGVKAGRVPKPTLKVISRKLPGSCDVDTDALFDLLFGQTDYRDTFWLDSSAKERCRFSFLGGPGGPLWRRLSYRLTSQTSGEVTLHDRDGRQETWTGSFWQFLNDALKRHIASACDLPFDFCGGYVGYLGYELKALCGGQAVHCAETPDAALFFVDQFVAVDHLSGDIYILALHAVGDAAAQEEAHRWCEATQQTIRQRRAPGPNGCACRKQRYTEARTGFQLERSPEVYRADIQRCMESLYAGDSYEICLTNKFRAARRFGRERELYRRLRSRNPAPYAAWLKFGSGAEAVTVCCSSPERFLKGDRDGVLEAKPIKGTAARHQDPLHDAAAAEALRSSEKDQAENLMIVDLLRNDLGRVCEPHSISVPSLMEVESFETVHQLVSTIRGKRRRGVSSVDAVRAAFPGGSMTGAPKIRTMQILDALEGLPYLSTLRNGYVGAPRGVYSGSIGYFSVNDTFDFNIVIRSAVLTSDSVVVGAGGAIVLQSDPDAELAEMHLKANTVLKSISTTQDITTLYL